MKVVAVADEHPMHPDTWSGSSAFFFRSLEARGLLAGAISAEPSAITQKVLQLRNFDPEMNRWRLRYQLDTALYDARSRTALRRLRQLDVESDAVLQIGATLDMTGAGLPVFSYHDGNLARLLDSPFKFPRVPQDCINRALRHERDLYARIEVIFTMSEWLASSFVNDFGVPVNKVQPVFAGINMPDVENMPDAGRDRRNILFVGKQFDRKGGQVLLSAFAKVRKSIPDATLTIVGPRLAEGIPGVVNPGFVSKQDSGGLAALRKMYSEASVFALPTLYEPFGIAYVEAMAHALPCVGSRICAVPEIVREGETGLLVNPGDAESLARALIELLGEPSRAKAYGEAGFRRYRDRFTWNQVAQRVEESIRARLG